MKNQIAQRLIQLRDLLGIEENEKTGSQIDILTKILDQYYFTEEQFDNACKQITEGTDKTYGKMPLFAEFKKLMENDFFKLETKEEAKKKFYKDQEKWIKRQLDLFARMVEDDANKRPAFRNFIDNHFNDSLKASAINDFKVIFLPNEELTVDNVRKKIKGIINIYNHNNDIAVTRLRQLFIEKEKKKARILNIQPIIEFNQNKVVKILNGNIQ